jgi:ATP sulfurylase
MTQAELESVLDDYRLPEGDVWTMPIVLQGKSQEFAAFQPGQSVRLIDTRTGRAIAVLQIEDKFEVDRDRVAERWFGTHDHNHPGVRRFAERGLTLLGGPIEYLGASSASRSPYELTPTQTRMIFDVKGWTKVVAFHTRSAPHAAHEHIIGQAYERSHADGVLIHPAIGPQNAVGFSDDSVLSEYEQLIRTTFPNALLAAFANYSRYAGPRETVFNALCRKNFGCTHFVVGDEAGDADGFDAADATRALFGSLGDIGITPVFFTRENFRLPPLGGEGWGGEIFAEAIADSSRTP